MPIVIDTNISLLLVVGMCGRELVSRHKRLKAFTEEDFDRVFRIVDHYSDVVISPNIASEISNLIGRSALRQNAIFVRKLAEFVNAATEVYVPSMNAVRRREYDHLGVTDAAILEILDDETELMTVDHNLHVAAIRSGYRATNYNHHRGY